MNTVQPPYTPFSVSVVPNRDEVGVVVAGELDLASTDAVAAAVEEVRGAGFDRVVLDLHRVDFIDSAGLRLLLSLRHVAQREGCALSIVPAAPAAQRIFDITQTHELFDWRRRFAA